MTIKRCYPVLVGASVAENQLLTNLSSRSQTLGITITVNNDGSITASGTATSTNSLWFVQSFSFMAKHVYLLKGSNGNGWLGTPQSSLKDTGNGVLFNITSNATRQIVFGFTEGVTYNETLYPEIIDLTLLFGSTIADYVYSLEQATAGSGIAWLRSYGFLKGYQAFNAGSIESVEVTEKVVRGFNQWDEEWELGAFHTTTGINVSITTQIRSKNYIDVIGGLAYFVQANPSVWCLFFDADKNPINSGYSGGTYNTSGNSIALGSSTPAFTIPNNARYMRFYCQIAYGTTYNHDICINLSSDRNGEYEPYTEQTYDYGTDTLNGIFKLDANNQLYAHGDVKTSDGVITRYYGTRAYQSGDESLADAITDGTTTVYKLTTPTTEQGDPFTSPQICYPDGTEEFVTENGVPVGHETKYQL